MGAPAYEQGFVSTNSELALEDVASATGDIELEYEYDDSVTEDYYFTLDVTTHQTSQVLKARNSKPKAQKGNGRKKDAEPNSTTARPGSGLPAVTPSNASASQVNGTASSTEDRGLQVLDLHADNPLVMFEDQFYSCHWSTDKGSQLYVARPGIARAPRRPGHVLDIVGISRARLVGRPAIVRPRKADSGTEIGASAENAIAIDKDGNDEDEGEEGVDVVTDISTDVLLQDTLSPTELFARARRKAKDPETKAQASFLERLSAIKEKKGETDKIPIYGVKEYEPPSNRIEIRDHAMTEDVEREKNAAPLTSSNRKRGPYKPRQSSSVETVIPAPQQKRRRSDPNPNIDIRGSLSLAGSVIPVNSDVLLDPQLAHAASPKPVLEASSSMNSGPLAVHHNVAEANQSNTAPVEPMSLDVTDVGDANPT